MNEVNLLPIIPLFIIFGIIGYYSHKIGLTFSGIEKFKPKL